MKVFQLTTTLHVIEIFDLQGVSCFNCSVFSLKANQLDLLSHKSNLQWDALVDSLNQAHFHLWVINDDGVIHSLTPPDEQHQQLKDQFPGLPPEECWIHEAPSGVSLCRKAHFQKWESKINEALKGSHFITLGIQSLSYLLEELPAHFCTAHFIFEQQNNRLLNWKPQTIKNEEVYSFGTLALPSSALLGFSALIEVLQKRPFNRFSQWKNLLSLRSASFTDYDGKMKRFHYQWSRDHLLHYGTKENSKMGAILLLVGMFFFFLSPKASSIRQMQNDVVHFQKQNLRLTDYLKGQNIRWNEIQALAKQKHAPILDSILLSIPKSIFLDELILDAQSQQTNVKEKYPQLKIKGISHNHDEFILWVDKLNLLDALSTVEVNEFNSKANTLDEFIFILTIPYAQ